METIDNTNRMKILSGSALKVIACLSMLSDHLAQFYLDRFDWANAEWFSIAGRTISLTRLMVMFGRFAFPLFVFLLVAGFEHTSNKKKYGLNLFIFALLSELPFNLMVGHSLFFVKQNMMFTLLLGYLAMCSITYFKQKPIFSLLIVAALFMVSRYLHADSQTPGFLFILLMYGLRKEKVIRCVAAPVLLKMKAMVFLSMLMTLLYNGKRGFIKTPFLKYCFYAFYPVHMLVIYWLSIC